MVGELWEVGATGRSFDGNYGAPKINPVSTSPHYTFLILFSRVKNLSENLCVVFRERSSDLFKVLSVPE